MRPNPAIRALVEAADLPVVETDHTGRHENLELAETAVVEEIATQTLYESKSANPLKILDKKKFKTVQQALADLDCDPIRILASMASGVDPKTGAPIQVTKSYKVRTGPDQEEVVVVNEGPDYHLQAYAAKELLQYIAPKLKQVEYVTDEAKAGMTITWNGPPPKWTQPRNVTPLAIAADRKLIHADTDDRGPIQDAVSKE